MVRLTGVLLVLLLIYQLVAQAKVSPNIITREEDPSSGVDYHSRRTLFNIIWGCVSTTIICAWAAIHPNIPPREGPFKGALRRLELMFWTIVAPEILPCWALNQRLAAMTVRDVYNNAKGYQKQRCGIWETVTRWFSFSEITEEASPAWTVAHGHFLIMGGFHLVEPPPESPEARTQLEAAPDAVDSTGVLLVDEANTNALTYGHGSFENNLERGRVTILTLEMLRKLVRDPEFQIQMTEEEITHRSKGDALSKIIFILQSTWFILQCIGRWVQGLNLTQLELTTLALASLNGVTFVLWWDKPLGAQAIVRVPMKRKLTPSERPVWRAGLDRSARAIEIAYIRDSVTTIRDAFSCQGNPFIQLPFSILLLVLSPIIGIASAFFATINDLLGRSSFFPHDDTHVPTFYVPNHRYSVWYHILLLVSLGAIFGGIHCSGWNFSFPSNAQQKLWRVASLVVTITPIATYPLVFVINSMLTFRPPSLEPFPLDLPGVSTYFVCTLAYVVARFILLILAVAHLKHLPPTAFIAIDWTQFYPHFL